jgi:hypothetical protein
MLHREAVKPQCFSSGSWIWIDAETGERTASIGYTSDLDESQGSLRLRYVVGPDDEKEHKDYQVRLSSIPLRYGGRRWYFHCPVTHRRVLKLYLVEGTFVARQAIRPKPTYRSQRVSGLDRVMEQRWTLRRRLGDTFSDLCGPPCKPKGMRWKTFEQFAERDEELSVLEDVHFARRFGLLARRLGVALK